MDRSSLNIQRILFGKTLAELQALAAELALPKYRAAQVFEAMYRGRVGSIEEMTVLPLALREQLMAGGYRVGRPEVVQTARSVDGTERYLMRMDDGETVELKSSARAQDRPCWQARG